MPEHDTYDFEGAIDAAFAHLEQDIAGVSSPRGAALAVTTARRRRRTTIGAVAAAAVLAVGGVAVAQGVGHHDTAIEPSSSLPAPAPLDADTLTSATQGWTSAWSSTVGSAGLALNGPISRCLEASPELNQVAEPVRSSGDLSFAAGETASFATLADFQDATAEADTLWTGLTDSVGQCPNAKLTSQRTWDGGEALSFALTSGSGKADHFWMARTGSTLGMLWIANAAEPVPADDDTAVMGALMSALRWPGSYAEGSSTGGSSGSSSSSSSAVATVSETGFAQALGDWSTGWQQNGSEHAVAGLPCDSGGWATGNTSGSGGSLGSNGSQEFDQFDSPADAATSAASLVQDLRDCKDGVYAVHSVPTAGGGTVTIAAGAGPQDSVLWIVQEGSSVGYIQVPAGDTPPPDAVSARIGGMLDSILADSPPQKGGDPVTSSSSVAATP